MAHSPTALRYYAYRGAVSVGFAAPVWYLYLADTASYAAAGLLQAVWWVGLVVFEVPTGYVADRIGWRRALLVGTAGFGASYLVIAAATDVLGLAVGFALGGFFGTFRSGTADAWLYESLEVELSGDAFSRVRGRGNAVMFVVSGATAVLGGYLADAVSMAATFAATGLVVFLAVPVVATFPRRADPEGPSAGRALTAVGAALRRPSVASVLAVGALTIGALWAVNLYVQPVLRGFSVPVGSLGWFYAGFTAVGAVLNYRAEWVRRRVGVRRWFRWAPPAMGLALLGVLVVPELAVALFFLARSGRSLTDTFAGQFVNDRVEGVGRATVLSAVGMVFQVAGAGAQAAAGWVGDAVGFLPGMAAAGACLLAGATLVAGAGPVVAALRRSAAVGR